MLSASFDKYPSFLLANTWPPEMDQGPQPDGNSSDICVWKAEPESLVDCASLMLIHSMWMPYPTLMFRCSDTHCISQYSKMIFVVEA